MDLYTLYELDIGVDFIITVKDGLFKIHKILLASQSKVFLEIVKRSPTAESMNLPLYTNEIFAAIVEFTLYDKNSKIDLSKNAVEYLKISDDLGINKMHEYIKKNLSKEMNPKLCFDLIQYNFKKNIDWVKKIIEEYLKINYRSFLINDYVLNSDTACLCYIISIIEDRLEYQDKDLIKLILSSRLIDKFNLIGILKNKRNLIDFYF